MSYVEDVVSLQDIETCERVLALCGEAAFISVSPADIKHIRSKTTNILRWAIGELPPGKFQSNSEMRITIGYQDLILDLEDIREMSASEYKNNLDYDYLIESGPIQWVKASKVLPSSDPRCDTHVIAVLRSY